MIEKIEYYFDKDKNFFQNYYKHEKKNSVGGVKNSDTETDVIQEEEKGETSESKKFLNVISNLIKFELSSKDYTYYIKILNIYMILSNNNIK